MWLVVDQGDALQVDALMIERRYSYQAVFLAFSWLLSFGDSATGTQDPSCPA